MSDDVASRRTSASEQGGRHGHDQDPPLHRIDPFRIEPHDAPLKDFPSQPSQKDGLGRMCATHWKAYVKGLNAERKAKTTAREAAAPGSKAEPSTTKRERRRTPMASRSAPASPKVRRARETLAATETLGGTAYTDAIASDEVQEALATINGHGAGEPDDEDVLVAGVLYDGETLEEAEPTDANGTGDATAA